MSRAAEWLRAWDSQGWHRTGTEGDQRGADWLAAEAAAMGAAVSIETFSLDRIDPVAAWIECGGRRIEAVPVFDSPSTPPDGVSEDIAIAELSPWAVYGDEYRSWRRNAAHKGLAIVCTAQEPGLSLLNAEQFGAPYGCPALHIAERPPEPIGRMVSYYLRTTVTACNVVVTIQGADPTRPPLVVMTPRSSWWQSTSERGGGIVCWLETLRALLTSRPRRDIVLTANSGHELGHLGLDAFLERRPGWDQPNGASWVHYGANIGAAGGELAIQSADTEFRFNLRSALTDAGQPPDRMAPPGQVPNGETRDIHRAGGRYITLVGTNRLFHLPQDRWPGAVDVAAIERAAAGASRFVAAMASA